MKKFLELIQEISDEEMILVIEISRDELTPKLLQITEGRWEPTGIKDYWQRIDTPRVPHEKLHVTIAHQKHIHSRNKQVTWNIDGTRKDRKTFDTNFTGMEKAKEIARNAIGIPSNTIIEAFEIKIDNLLLESEGLNATDKLRYILIELQ